MPWSPTHASASSRDPPRAALKAVWRHQAQPVGALGPATQQRHRPVRRLGWAGEPQDPGRDGRCQWSSPSWPLRPAPQEFGLTLHPSGWVAVDYLLAAHCTVTR